MFLTEYSQWLLRFNTWRSCCCCCCFFIFVFFGFFLGNFNVNVLLPPFQSFCFCVFPLTLLLVTIVKVPGIVLCCCCCSSSSCIYFYILSVCGCHHYMQFVCLVVFFFLYFLRRLSIWLSGKMMIVMVMMMMMMTGKMLLLLISKELPFLWWLCHCANFCIFISQFFLFWFFAKVNKK